MAQHNVKLMYGNKWRGSVCILKICLECTDIYHRDSEIIHMIIINWNFCVKSKRVHVCSLWITD